MSARRRKDVRFTADPGQSPPIGWRQQTIRLDVRENVAPVPGYKLGTPVVRDVLVPRLHRVWLNGRLYREWIEDVAVEVGQ